MSGSSWHMIDGTHFAQPTTVKRLLIWVSLLFALGCSSTIEEPDTTVWGPKSSSLSLKVTGGPQGFDESFSYERSTASLNYECQRFCIVGTQRENGPVSRSLQLDPAGADNLDAQLAGLAVSNDGSRCAVDDPERELTVTSSTGTKSYVDDSNAGCPDATDQPLITMEAATELQNTFTSLAQSE